jgi:membrane fusion protein (multidrug efflux system)
MKTLDPIEPETVAGAERPVHHRKEARPGRKRRIAAGAGGIAAVLGIILWVHSLGRVSTDDAYLESHVLPVSSRVAGQALRVEATDNQAVKAGDLLVEIDPRDYDLKLAQRRAELAAARAEARRAASDAGRARQLFGKGQVSRQAEDAALSSADVALAQSDLAEKKVAAAELDLGDTRIKAPADGQVARKGVEPGSFVQVGQPLMALVTPDVWVTANFKETQLTRVRPGQKVRIEVDAFPGRTYHGHVDSVQRGTGARFSLFPPENATGNFVKVVQRVPVKIVFDEPPEALLGLAPGMSAVPTILLD